MQLFIEINTIYKEYFLSVCFFNILPSGKIMENKGHSLMIPFNTGSKCLSKIKVIQLKLLQTHYGR